MTAPHRHLRVLLVAAVLLAAAGCSGGDDDPDGPEEPGATDQVTYLTGFQASAHDAFIFVADENGQFADAGIDLTIELGAGSANYQALLAGQAGFTYTDLTGMLLSIGRGELTTGDFVALIPIHHQTLAAIVAPADAGVTGPEDLTGKRIGVFTGSPTELLLPAYAEAAGWTFDPELVVGSNAQELFGLLASGQVDLLSTFIIQQGVIESVIGRGTVALPFDEHLDNVLGTGLITTTALAQSDPDLVERFRDAALAGLRDTLADPERAIEILRERQPGAVEDPAPLVDQIRVMDPYITGAGDDRVGVFDLAEIELGIATLVDAGLIPDGTAPEAIIGDLSLSTGA